MTHSWKNTLLLFIPGMLWGGSFVLTEIALATITPFTLTAVRNLTAALGFIIMLYARRQRLSTSLADWRAYLLIGIFSNGLPYVLSTWGQVYIESGLASIIVSTMPLFTILLAHFFTADERLTLNKVIGISLGLVSVVVLIGPAALSGLGLNLGGQLAVLAASISYAVGAIFTRRYFQNERVRTQLAQTGSLGLIAGQFLSSTLFLLPLSFVWERPLTLQPSLPSLLALLVLSLPVTILSVQVYYYLIDVAGASFAAISVYLIPINAVFLGALVLGERITWQAVVALCLILLGIGVVNGMIRLRSTAVQPTASSG